MINNTQGNIDKNTDSIPSQLSEKERLRNELLLLESQTNERKNRIQQLENEEWEGHYIRLMETIKSTPVFRGNISSVEHNNRFNSISQELRVVMSIPQLEVNKNKIGKTTSEERHEILKLHSEGKTKWEIGRQVKRNVNTVEKIIKEGMETV